MLTPIKNAYTLLLYAPLLQFEMERCASSEWSDFESRAKNRERSVDSTTKGSLTQSNNILSILILWYDSLAHTTNNILHRVGELRAFDDAPRYRVIQIVKRPLVLRFLLPSGRPRLQGTRPTSRRWIAAVRDLQLWQCWVVPAVGCHPTSTLQDRPASPALGISGD